MELERGGARAVRAGAWAPAQAKLGQRRGTSTGGVGWSSGSRPSEARPAQGRELGRSGRWRPAAGVWRENRVEERRGKELVTDMWTHVTAFDRSMIV